MDADAPTYRESLAAFIADQLRERSPRVHASDIVRYLERWHGLPTAIKAEYRIEKVDA